MVHLKRLKAPRSWKIERKVAKWAVKPSPGPHPVERSIPLLFVVRDYLRLADVGREAKKIIASRKVLVDGKARRDYKFPCGLMDVISLPEINEHYRVLFDARGVLRLVKIDEEHAKWKLCRIEGKTMVRGGKIQLNLHDGRNIVTEKNEYKTGDVLKISVPEQEILEHIPMQKGYLAMIIGGKHAGEIAKIEEIVVTRSPLPNIVKLENITTIKPYVFPIGKEEPLIRLPEVSIYE
ncbi:30S ribosomal protein S4e [Thermoplasmatales archaeon ex4484_30]|nr:MAG: 30S ribosomal protein S4e [Thermoplasmatales archaeon ex4484_30]